ncbi:MAG: hypothetical protein SFU85_05580 [Candidatus Methylacidiphilales bacterium]|nr:hypothetical protein [Candidatus Methylacidiphilales bacterium]
MKTPTFPLLAALVLVPVFALAPSARAAGLSAFAAQKLAAREVNDEAKKSLVQISGKKSSIGVMPIEWQILFYDPYADQNGTKVTVAGNTITRIEQGYTQVDKLRLAAYKLEEVIEPAKLRKDSSDVLDILNRSSELSKVKVSSIELWLHKEGKGPAAPAIWRTRIWAQAAGSDKEIDIGTARINAQSGQIVELKLDLKKIQK